jgi:hypothetical protein
MREMRNAYNISVGKPGEKSPLERHTHGWDDNIKTRLREIMCEVVELIHLYQDRHQWWAVVNTVMKLRVS